jgi:hypothetical protein
VLRVYKLCNILIDMRSDFSIDIKAVSSIMVTWQTLAEISNAVQVAVNDSIDNGPSRDTMDLRFSICCFKNHLVDDEHQRTVYIRLGDSE